MLLPTKKKKIQIVIQEPCDLDTRMKLIMSSNKLQHSVSHVKRFLLSLKKSCEFEERRSSNSRLSFPANEHPHIEPITRDPASSGTKS